MRSNTLRRAVLRVAAAVAIGSAALTTLVACSRNAPAPSSSELAAMSWNQILASAKGTTVTWRMWRGDPSINAYVDSWVAPRLQARYGITLNPVDAQGPEILNQLAIEKQAQRGAGSTDLVWINGETFYNLRKSNLLFGPWAGRLPNATYVDSSSAIIARDFEQDPAGYESPWGTVQFALIYDTVRTPSPPRTVAQLRGWIRAHPGRFTYDQSFTGVTFLNVLMYALNGGAQQFQGGFNEAKYAKGSGRVWDWLTALRPSLWRKGEAYPSGVAELHGLFANGEVDFSMSNNQNDVVTKVRQGILPPTARPLLLRDGTIANTHYLGIAANAGNPAGAMVVADFLLSPEAQLQKQKPDVWADGTVLSMERLPAEWSARFRALSTDSRSLSHDSLSKYARPEVAPQYHERLQTDWRNRIRANVK
ncbi:MAG: ABC transporter substrate-binding protein [Gemmatimonadaceae bacterium]